MEGILFGGVLLTKDEFINIFKQWYQIKGENFKQRIKNLYENAGKMNNAEIYSAWDVIQNEWFGNDSVSIMFIRPNLSSKGQYEFTKILDEKKLLNKQTISGSDRNISKNLLNAIEDKKILEYAKNLEFLLNQHYSGLLHTLSKAVTKEQAAELHYIFGVKKMINKFKHFYTKDKKTLDEIIYLGLTDENQFGQIEGKHLDAFMNHLANNHKQIFDFFKDSEKRPALPYLRKTVFQEEGSLVKFTQLLIDSLNNTPWYASGDILIVDKNRKPLYNIQLKSTQNKGQTYDIATIDFLKLLDSFIKEKDIDKMAKLLYEELKTNSSNEIQPEEQKFEEDILAYIYTKLKIDK